MHQRRPIILLGNGGAALAAARALRERGYAGEILLVSDSSGPPYNPMLLPHAIAGEIPFEKCCPYGADFSLHRSLGLTVRAGSPVVELDARARWVRTEAGAKLSFSRCLVATGASAHVPAALGGRSGRILALRTPDDALAVRALVAGGASRALILGASMVGVKLAEILAAAGVHATLADVAGHVFPAVAHPECARRLEKGLAAHGIALRLAAVAEEAEESRGGVRVRLGEEWGEFDFVLAATGVRPNVAFVDPGEIDVAEGILVDEGMRSTSPDVFAAGDAAQGRNSLTGGRQLSPSWSNALRGGRTAGRNLAGAEARYGGSVPANLSRFCGLEFVNVGDALKGDGASTFAGGATYIRLVWKDDRLSGANLINCRSPGAVRHAVAKGVRRSRSAGFLRALLAENPRTLPLHASQEDQR